jgi:hypothetical protein
MPAMPAHDVDRSHDHVGRAVAAPKCVIMAKRRLHRTQFVAIGMPSMVAMLEPFACPTRTVQD